MPKGHSYMPVWEQAAREADLTLHLPGGVPMLFRLIPAGSFRMGARGHSPDEEPIHRVVIPEDFFLGTFVVTQAQYRAVAGRCPTLKKETSPSHFKGARRPVENVSWLDATAFCDWLTQWPELPEGIATARLPTEAEWEYAGRAGSEMEYYCGDDEAALAEVAWYDENTGEQTHPVDERPESHPFGLYGMHGNVWEWCRDIYDPAAFRKRPEAWLAREWTLQDAGEDARTFSSGPATEQNATRVRRGGSWRFTAFGCRSAGRSGVGPGVRDWGRGFRVCLVRGPVGQRGTQPATAGAAAPAPRYGGRGTRPESKGAGAGGGSANRTLA